METNSTSSDSDSEEKNTLLAASCIKNYGLAWDTNRPWRRRCEDTHTMQLAFNGTKTDCFFAIYDGHASKAVSNYCEEHLYQMYAKNLGNKPGIPTPDVAEQIKKLVPKKFGDAPIEFKETSPLEPHELVQFRTTYAQVDEQLKKKSINWGGACAVTCYIHQPTTPDAPRFLYTANCGDSRAVLVRSSKALRVSYDHSLSDPAEVKRVEAAGGSVSGGRINNTIAVTRALGDMVLKKLIISDPFTRMDVLDKDCSHIILACDGIWDVLSDQDVADIILSPDNGKLSLDLLARKVINTAKEKKSRDNLSIIIIEL